MKGTWCRRLDCCHSGSGTRNLKSSSDTRRARGFVLKGVLPTSLDHDIWRDIPRGRDIEVVKGFTRAGSKSHVLLAACRETETAFERNERGGKERGFFTLELLRALRMVNPDKITYQDLIQRIPTIPGYVLVHLLAS